MDSQADSPRSFEEPSQPAAPTQTRDIKIDGLTRLVEGLTETITQQRNAIVGMRTKLVNIKTQQQVFQTRNGEPRGLRTQLDSRPSVLTSTRPGASVLAGGGAPQTGSGLTLSISVGSMNQRSDYSRLRGIDKHMFVGIMRLMAVTEMLS